MANSIFRTPKKSGQRNVWQDFLNNKELQREHHVTDEEIEMLKNFAPLGMLTGNGDILFILNKIRWARLRNS